MHNFLHVFGPTLALILLIIGYWCFMELGFWLTLQVLIHMPHNSPDRPSWNRLRYGAAGYYYAWKYRRYLFKRRK